MKITLILSIFLTRLSYYTTNAVCCSTNSTALSCIFSPTLQTSVKDSQFISANLHGTIGDYLFIICNTISYSMKYNIPFIFHPQSGGQRRDHNNHNLIGISTNNQSKIHDNKNLNLLWFEKDNIFDSINCITTLTYPHMNTLLPALPTHRLSHNDFLDNATSPVSIMAPHRIIGNYQSYKHFDSYKQTIFSILNLEKTRKQVLTKYSQNYGLSKKITIGINFMSISHNHTQVSIPYRYYLLAITDAINKRK